MTFHGAEARGWAGVVAVVLIIPIGIPAGAVLDSQRLDGTWPGKGMDQHSDHSGSLFLSYRDADWIYRRVLGKDSMGKEFEPEAVSYRVARSVRDATHLMRQY